jgi:hypothetical protein
MRIAVIGWGSLIWCPGSLQISTRWRTDGPDLPIEFARISGDGRLTLVIHPGSPRVRTYWAVSAFDTLVDARSNLQGRESTSPSQIDAACTKDGDTPMGSEASAIVRSWLMTHQNLDAAVWTGLHSNWQTRRGKRFNPDDALKYLSDLEVQRDEAASRYGRACEYVRNTPDQIQTNVRKMLCRKNDFKSAVLPSILFEPNSIEPE